MVGASLSRFHQVSMATDAQLRVVPVGRQQILDVLRALLDQDPNLQDLSVSASNLEDAINGMISAPMEDITAFSPGLPKLIPNMMRTK